MLMSLCGWDTGPLTQDVFSEPKSIGKPANKTDGDNVVWFSENIEDLGNLQESQAAADPLGDVGRSLHLIFTFKL